MPARGTVLCRACFVYHTFLLVNWGRINMACAVIAAVVRLVTLHPMAKNRAAAMRTRRRQQLRGAFKTVESMGFTVQQNLEGFVVIVSASFTLSHTSPLIF